VSRVCVLRAHSRFRARISHGCCIHDGHAWRIRICQTCCNSQPLCRGCCLCSIAHRERARLTLRAAAFAAALAGFVSLSCEILWFRVYSYITGGSPVTFGLLLGIYLAGLAVGADLAGKSCRDRREHDDEKGRRILAWFAYFANAAAFLVIPLMAASTRTPVRGCLSLFAFIVSAGLFGALLPLISHLGIRATSSVGEKLSYVYFANIVGAVLGSLLTGFVITDFLPTRYIALAIAIAGLGVVWIV